MNRVPVTEASSNAVSRARPRARRFSLRLKIFLTLFLPVLLMALLIGALLVRQRQHTLSTVSHALAASVSRILATTLDVQDLTLVQIQLRAAVGSESVAFVDVRPEGEALRFFVSKDPQSDWYLKRAYDRFRLESPRSEDFRFVDGRSAAYTTLRGLLEDVPPVAGVQDNLERGTERYRSSAGQVQHYQVIQVGVYATAQGERLLREQNAAASGGAPARKLFDLGIGVQVGELRGLLDRQLRGLLWACAGVLLLTLLLALWVGEVRVRPILRLTEAANRISLGQMGSPVRPDGNDELSDLAESIERLRTSLVLAMSRLRPGKPR